MVKLITRGVSGTGKKVTKLMGFIFLAYPVSVEVMKLMKELAAEVVPFREL